MNIYDIIRELDVNRLRQISSEVYPAKIPSSTVTVPAGDTADDDISIPNNTAFLCTRITGRFTTLTGGADDGVCRLLMKITDTGRSLPMFQDFCFLDLFLTPGRRKNSVALGNATHQYFYPDEFVHLFKANSTIHLDFKSTAGTDNNFVDLIFHGYKFKLKTTSGTNTGAPLR